MNKKDTTASTTIDECITFYLGSSLSECTDIHLNTSANQKNFLAQCLSCIVLPRFVRLYKYLIKVTCYTHQSYDIQHKPANYWV